MIHHDDMEPVILPATNADRIRAMSDEELADEIEEWFLVMYNHEIAHDDLVSWLKSPVEGE